MLSSCELLSLYCSLLLLSSCIYACWGRGLTPSPAPHLVAFRYSRPGRSSSRLIIQIPSSISLSALSHLTDSRRVPWASWRLGQTRASSPDCFLRRSWRGRRLGATPRWTPRPPGPPSGLLHQGETPPPRGV